MWDHCQSQWNYKTLQSQHMHLNEDAHIALGLKNKMKQEKGYYTIPSLSSRSLCHGEASKTP